MVKRNTRISRIDVGLAEWIHEIAINNELSETQASRELAKLKRRLSGGQGKITREIRF